MWADRSANGVHDSGLISHLTEMNRWVRAALAQFGHEPMSFACVIEPTGYYHFVVVRALGGEPSVVKTLVAGPYKRITDKLEKAAKKSGQKRPKAAKSGQNNQFDWSTMPPKMGQRSSSEKRAKAAKNG